MNRDFETFNRVGKSSKSSSSKGSKDFDSFNRVGKGSSSSSSKGSKDFDALNRDFDAKVTE